MKILTALAVLPIALGFYNSFEDGADLTTVAGNITKVANVDSGHAFDLGGGRTFGDALDSCTFAYDNCKKF